MDSGGLRNEIKSSGLLIDFREIEATPQLAVLVKRKPKATLQSSVIQGSLIGGGCQKCGKWVVRSVNGSKD